MPVVNVEPSRDHPVPYNTDDEYAPTLLEKLAVAGNTAELQVALGASLEISSEDLTKTKSLLEEVAKNETGEKKNPKKALELLGKHSDIGLFTERSEITINYKTPEALEDAIKERVKRLLNADIVDITPLGMDLDEELGMAGADAEFEDAAAEDAEFEDVKKESEAE